jgi:hypothetical protein
VKRAVLLAVVLLAAACGDDETGTSPSTTAAPPTTTTSTAAPTTDTTTAATTTTADADLTGAAGELADAISRAAALTYHATYHSPPGATTVVAVDVYLKAPLARRDIVLGEGDRTLHSREYRTADQRRVGCLVGDTTGETSCREVTSGDDDPGDPLLGAIDPGAGTVEARDDTVAGVAARCFTVLPADGGPSAEACFDADGIPVTLDGGDGDAVARTGLEREVADDAFVPPVPLQEPADG